MRKYVQYGPFKLLAIMMQIGIVHGKTSAAPVNQPFAMLLAHRFHLQWIAVWYQNVVIYRFHQGWSIYVCVSMGMVCNVCTLYAIYVISCPDNAYKTNSKPKMFFHNCIDLFCNNPHHTVMHCNSKTTMKWIFF